VQRRYQARKRNMAPAKGKRGGRKKNDLLQAASQRRRRAAVVATHVRHSARAYQSADLLGNTHQARSGDNRTVTSSAVFVAARAASAGRLK